MITAWSRASLRAASSQVRHCATMAQREADRNRYHFLQSAGCDPSVRIQYNDLLKRYLEEGRAAELFQIWKEDFKKVYNDEEEEHKRFKVFEKTLKSVVVSNPTAGYSEGLNCFADKSTKEMLRWCGGAVEPDNLAKIMSRRREHLE